MSNYAFDNDERSASDERERFRAVMTSVAYKGREASAQQMLFNTDMTSDAIVGVLASLPMTAAKPRAANDRGPLGILTAGSVAPPSAGAAIINTHEIYSSRRQAASAAAGARSSTEDTSDVYARRRPGSWS